MSNSGITIQAKGLGKRYKYGEVTQTYKSFRESLANAALAPIRAIRASRNGDARRAKENTFWAVRDVSLEVFPGEVLGMIGRNGAGKSTLLKVLSRITRPTEGRAEIHGRVGSLLEVGTGFHPELTGRENVFLNGAILGMSRREILKKFDEIVAFSQVEKFIDTAVKHYSSGMYVRLAFAVAAHLDTEILFIDEVLSVGDAEFQKKCLNKMQDVGESGRTVVLVSHSMTAIQRLCTRVIWLDGGKLIASGSAKSVVGDYLRTSSAAVTEREWPDQNEAPGNETVRIKSAAIRQSHLSDNNDISVRTAFTMEFEYWNLKPDTRISLSLLLHTHDGTLAFNTGPARERVWNGKPFPAGLFRSVCHVPGNLLNNGTHRLSVLVVENRARVIFRYEDILTFEVVEDAATRDGWYGDWPGAIRPALEWTTELVENPAAGYASAGAPKAGQTESR